ncbi:MAG TPA: ATP-binding protein [Thermoanaerobaculia bacterium]|nr:ATP-binding protein [Thermoanaerobaculia bacterium]
MRRPVWSMRAWLATFAVVTVLPLLVLLAVIFALQVRREEREARETALRTARVTAEGLRGLYTDSLVLLEKLAKRPDIRDFDGKRCDALFPLIDFFPQYADLFLFDARGALVCGAQPQPDDVEVSRAARQWLETELRAGRLIPRHPLIRYLQGRWVSAEAIDAGHGNRLVLVQLPDIEVRDVLASSSVVTIVDENGIVVARTREPERWVGRRVTNRGVAATAMREKNGRTADIGIDGIERQYGFTYIPEIGWHVYVGVTTAEVMRPVRTTYARGVMAGAAILLLVALAAIFLSQTLARSINRLARAAGEVAKGAYGTVEVTRGPSEITQLAESFNAMVASRAAAEQQMQDSERNLKALSDRLLVVQEQERTRIARELHDDLGQSLTALKMDVVGILQSAERSPVRERIVETLDSIVTAVQRISSELRPSLLDDLGLTAAIEAEARVFEERTAIECELSLPDHLALDSNVAVAIYRIIQEAFTNVARHSNASRVELRIRPRENELLIDIRDDGCGITPAQVHDSDSLGLIGIRERASIIGASVTVEGVPGRGTIVSVYVPLTAGERQPT